MVKVFIKRYFEAGQIRLYCIQYLEAFDIMMYKLIETVLSLGVLGLDIRNPILEKPWSTLGSPVQSSDIFHVMISEKLTCRPAHFVCG